MVRKFNFKCIVCLIVLFAVVIPYNLSAQSRGKTNRTEKSQEIINNSILSDIPHSVEESIKQILTEPTNSVKLMTSDKGLKKNVQTNSVDEVSLIVSGEGETKEEATKVALRSAIEQAFGAFVSSDTRILNDEIVKDEIITVSSGNVKSYDYLSEYKTDKGYFVNLRAVVSLGKLITYVQNKGGSTELAGATFAMNVKLCKMNIENERVALENLLTKVEKLIPSMFDYSIEVEEPYAIDNHYCCRFVVKIKANENLTNVSEFINETINGLKITPEEKVQIEKYTEHSAALLKRFKLIDGKEEDIVLRSAENFASFTSTLNVLMANSFYTFSIVDDLGEYHVDRVYHSGRHKLISNNDRRISSLKWRFREEISLYHWTKEWGWSLGRYFYPVDKYGVITVNGILIYSEEELGKISKISVQNLIPNT